MRLSVWLAFAVALVTFQRAAPLSCAPCRPEQCKLRSPRCKYGVVRDTCSCCVTCGKGPGQLCGGPWDSAGRCGHHLYCKKRPHHREPYAEFNALGKCRRPQAARQLPRDDDVVFPDAEHVQQDEMERAARHEAGALSLISPLPAA
ncbi:venom protein 302-like [Pollicipes pollicipes]|uniref:venom protein 302-like n=1 Tax=Pollicipes pollicipes TaxID=41117 RepID=UPI0018851F95|nr:venom protein 302-like [Pollicipes pollicipes]XP_037092130.1 venom protein 302-like [Pollicipes pollicipes]XP_037092616.1 venom protein 302-like [Pollicipes pollicipes]